jgi:anaerobic carbon-monoxide dehydrogenase iron sulfur subunit
MRLSVKDSLKCVGCQLCMFACSRRQGNAGLSNTSIGIKSAGGISNGFKVVICRSCYNPPCAAVCPTDALVQRPERGVKFDATKCIGCGLCQDACIVNAVFWNGHDNKPAICLHCGYCVKYCPHHVLEMIN